MAKVWDGGPKCILNRNKAKKEMEKDSASQNKLEKTFSKELMQSKVNRFDTGREGTDACGIRGGQNTSQSPTEKTDLENAKSKEAENLKKMYEAIKLAEGGSSEKLLVDGAILLCQKGTTPTPLIVTPPTHVAKSEKQQANKMHCVAGANFNQFGDCKVIKKPCSPSIVGPWMKSTANGKAGQDMISMESFMVCAIGGLILPLTSGLGMAVPGSVGTLNQAIIADIRNRYPELDKDTIRSLFGELTSAQLSLMIYGNGSPDKNVTVEDLIAAIGTKTLKADDVINRLGLDIIVDVEKLLAWSELLGIQSRDKTREQMKLLYGPLNLTEEGIEYMKVQCKEDANVLAPAHPIPGSDLFNSHVDKEYRDTLIGYPGHTGVDIGTSGVSGFPVRATRGGVVDRAGVNPGYSINRAYGFYVRVIDDYGRKNIYGHLNGGEGEEGRWSSIVVNVGDYVLPGQLLGVSGNTGNSTGSHLHYEVQPENSSEGSQSYLDPRDPSLGLLPGELCRSN